MSRASGKSLLGSLLKKHALRVLDDLIDNNVNKHLNKPKPVIKRNKTMTVVFGNNTNSNDTSSNDKVVPQVYLNVGQTVDVPTGDGTTEKKFVSIPIGISIDTMTPTVARGKDPMWLAQVGIKNALLAQLQAFGENMKAGESEMVEGLELQILKRQAPAVAPAAADNPIESTPLKLVGSATG